MKHRHTACGLRINETTEEQQMLPAALSWSGVVTVLSMKLSTAAVSSSQESVTLSKCFSGFTQLDAAQCSANRKAVQVNPFTEGILKSGTLVLVINNKRVRHRVTESLQYLRLTV